MGPGQSTEFTPPADTRITNIALGEKLEDENSRTTVRLIYVPAEAQGLTPAEEAEIDDIEKIKATILCSLTPGKVRSANDFPLHYSLILAVLFLRRLSKLLWILFLRKTRSMRLSPLAKSESLALLLGYPNLIQLFD